MTAEFAPDAGGGSGDVRVDLVHWRWVIDVYLDDLVDLLGPPPDVPDHPLDALAN